MAHSLLTNHQFKCILADASMSREDGVYIYNHFPTTKRMLVTGNAQDKMLEKVKIFGGGWHKSSIHSMEKATRTVVKMKKS